MNLHRYWTPVATILILTIRLVQAETIVEYNLTGAPGNQSSTAGTSPMHITAADLGRGAGLNASSASNSISSNNWTGESTDYYEFGFDIQSGFEVDLDTIFMGSRSSNTGPGTLGVYSSADGFTTPITTITQAGTAFSYTAVDLSGLGTVTGNVRFRIQQIGTNSANGGTTSSGGTMRLGAYVESGQPTRNFQVTGTVGEVGGGDSVAPLATSFSPEDNATNAPITATPTVIFNEPIQKGSSGAITIRRSSDDSLFESIAIASSQITASQNTVTIIPGTDLEASTGYYIVIPQDAIEDVAGNGFAGVQGTTTWNFTTLAATAAPMATKTFTNQVAIRLSGPSVSADYYGEGSGQGNFALYSAGSFDFSKLDFALSGSSVITGVTSAEFTLTHNDRTFTQGSELEFFLTTQAFNGNYTDLSFDPTFVNGINNNQFDFAPVSLGRFPYTPQAGGIEDTFTLDLTQVEAALVSRLNTGEEFNIILAATTPSAAITYSGKGNTFDPGDPMLKLTVSETTGTDLTPPTIAILSPADNSGGLPVSSNLSVSFNEVIQKGTGSITVFRSADDSVFEILDVNSPNVTVSLGTVTIDPVGTLELAGSYYVQFTPGSIQDTSGNDFAGISDETTWNFSTAQPPITNSGPFAISENDPAGTLVGDLNTGVTGSEGIRYALIGGSGSASMMKAVPGNGYLVTPIFTIGDTLTGATGALNPTSAGDYSPPGVPDGLGAFELDANTVRVFMNHEIEIPSSGSGAFPFTLANGTVITKGGARISYFDIDKASRRVTDSGLAIARMYDRSGNEVTSTSQLEMGGLDRTCSSALFEPDLWGAGRGLVDRLYIMGEETSTPFGHPHGGTYWALDTSNGDLWALPDFGRGSWENASLVDTGTTTHVAFLLGDDAPARPLYLYVGEKDTSPGANFVERNGLAGGQVYVWTADNGDTTPQQFNGTGSTRTGTWVAFDVRDVSRSGNSGFDASGYKDDTTMKTDAVALGAFTFARPEDLSASPSDGSIIAFTSTGRGSVYPLDNWGATYILDIDFTAGGVPTTGNIEILYDGDDAGGGQFMSPEEGVRNPDNLDWADDGYIYVQEDRANQIGSFGAAGYEASIWRLDSITGAAARVTEIDRSTVLPLGSTDGDSGSFGEWESSGILDVSTLFGESPGTLFLFDVQAHSVTNGLIASKELFEGGQLCFLEKGLATGAFALSPNTGVITIANPDALDATRQPTHGLRFQAYDGTNTTLRQTLVNVTDSPVATSNSFRAAQFNTSLYRSSAGALINDLSTVTNSQAQSIARIIQRNDADVILVNEFDYDEDGRAARLFRENYLEVGQSGESPVYYPYSFVAPSNTGVASGKDFDNNGSTVITPGASGYGEDAFGFGEFEGQYAFVIYSKFPIDTSSIRTFQKFLWRDMPGALLPDDPDLPGTGDWYSADELDVFRLSSKNHADVPVLVNGTRIHILACHPTPPVFDSPGEGPWKAGVDHNGRRNSDEIRFWSDYVTPASSGYIYDDNESPVTASGGLEANARFIICGDLNADEDEGDSTPPAITTVLSNPLVNNTFVPAGGAGPDPDDTAGFSGGVRVDYALPSVFGMNVDDGGVFWPASGDPIIGALSASDHHLVFLNLTLNGVDLPAITDIVNYYQGTPGLSGEALLQVLHNLIDDHVVIDYGIVDEIMQVIDEAESNAAHVRLIYSNATLPKTAFSGSGASNWNREHVWPRSDGVGNEGADYSDLHHLFPCQTEVNSHRSNFPFDVSTGTTTTDPFAPESTLDLDSWEPLDRDKGLVARALLYMMTRYDGSDVLTTDLMLADNPSSTGVHGILSTLLAWNRQFPPSDYEEARNNAIYSGIQAAGQTHAQGNRNPFVDFPQLADAIFLDTGTHSFLKWQWQNFTLSQLLNPAISAATSDSEGDGDNNRFEFLLRGNVNSGGDVPLQTTRNGNQLTLTFYRPKGVAEQAAIESSTTLAPGSWIEIPGWEAASDITDLGDYECIEFTTTVPMDPENTFYRIHFE